MYNWKIFWDNLADSKDDLLSADWIHISKAKYAKRIEYICKILNLNEEDILFDIGCGKGIFVHYNKRKIKNYFGLDFSWKLLFEGQKKKGTGSITYNFVQANCKCLPFKNSSINKIISNSVSQNLREEEFREMLSEIDRVLRRPGICFLGDINHRSISPLFSNKKKMDKNFNIYFRLISLLKKINFIVFLKSTIIRICLEIKKRIVDYKRGFKIQRIRLNEYNADEILHWIRDINVELECNKIEQGENAFYPNRYDVLIKK